MKSMVTKIQGWSMDPIEIEVYQGHKEVLIDIEDKNDGDCIVCIKAEDFLRAADEIKKYIKMQKLYEGRRDVTV